MPRIAATAVAVSVASRSRLAPRSVSSPPVASAPAAAAARSCSVGVGQGTSVASTRAAAQRLTLPNGALTPGAQITIHYADPQRANQVIVLDVDDGGYPKPATVQLLLELDRRGRGSVRWEVPAWEGVRVNAPGVVEAARPVKPVGAR